MKVSGTAGERIFPESFGHGERDGYFLRISGKAVEQIFPESFGNGEREDVF